MSETLPPGATQYFKRPLPEKADGLPLFLGRELGIIERAIRDRRLRPQRHTDTNLTLTEQDDIVYVDATSAAITITLPDVRRFWGFPFNVKKVDASANVVTVDAGATTIDGAATFPLTVQYQSVTLISDGTEWWVL